MPENWNIVLPGMQWRVLNLGDIIPTRNSMPENWNMVLPGMQWHVLNLGENNPTWEWFVRKLGHKNAWGSMDCLRFQAAYTQVGMETLNE